MPERKTSPKVPEVGAPPPEVEPQQEKLIQDLLEWTQPIVNGAWSIDKIEEALRLWSAWEKGEEYGGISLQDQYPGWSENEASAMVTQIELAQKQHANKEIDDQLKWNLKRMKNNNAFVPHVSGSRESLRFYGLSDEDIGQLERTLKQPIETWPLERPSHQEVEEVATKLAEDKMYWKNPRVTDMKEGMLYAIINGTKQGMVVKEFPGWTAEDAKRVFELRDQKFEEMENKAEQTAKKLEDAGLDRRDLLALEGVIRAVATEAGMSERVLKTMFDAGLFEEFTVDELMAGANEMGRSQDAAAK